MTNTDINYLKTARSSALKNAKMLIDGGDNYPTHDDIGKANLLIEAAMKIDAMLRSFGQN